MNDYCKITVENVFHVLAQLQIFNQDAALNKKKGFYQNIKYFVKNQSETFSKIFSLFMLAVFFLV